MRKGVFVTLFFAVLLPLWAPMQTQGQTNPPNTSGALSEESLPALKELKLNSGITSLYPYAHAYYKLGVEKRRAGNYIRAVQAFQAASELDPYYLDPHFSLFRAYLFRDPARAFAQITDVVKTLREDFLGQYFFFKNVVVMSYFALLFALALFTAFACVRHITRLKHAISERLAAEMSANAAGWVGLFVLLQPLVWGLGIAGALLCYSGSLWKCMSRREKFIGLAFLVLVLGTPLLSVEVARRFPPIGQQSPAYVSYEALRGGWSQELENALVRYTEAEPRNSLYHFAYGTVARRAGKLGIARTELETAVHLTPRDAASLNNLANVYFNVENIATAENLYRRAVEADPTLGQPHYNLGQIYTKRLMFADANREFKMASEANPELIAEFSLNSREQLNRSVIDVDPTAADFWRNLLNERTGASPAVISATPLRLLGIGTWRRSSAVSIFFALSMLGGILAFRNLYTYSCSNCGKVICRKCLSRVHRKLFCLKCGAAASALKSEEFTRLLLNNQLRLEARKTRPISMFVGTFVPGFRLVQRGDAISGFLFILLTSVAAVYLYRAGSLIDYVPSLRYQHEHLVKYVLIIVPLALIHALILFWLSRRASPQPVSLKLVKTQPAGTMVKDGTTGKS